MQPGIISDKDTFAKAGDLRDKGVADLAIRIVQADGMTFMQSAWFPTDAELARMNAGAPVLLSISAPRHPVVSLGVGEPPAK